MSLNKSIEENCIDEAKPSTSENLSKNWIKLNQINSETTKIFPKYFQYSTKKLTENLTDFRFVPNWRKRQKTINYLKNDLLYLLIILIFCIFIGFFSTKQNSRIQDLEFRILKLENKLLQIFTKNDLKDFNVRFFKNNLKYDTFFY